MLVSYLGKRSASVKATCIWFLWINNFERDIFAGLESCNDSPEIIEVVDRLPVDRDYHRSFAKSDFVRE